VKVAGHVLRALKHHVLEEMRETCPAGLLVRRPDVIPEVHGHERKPVIFAQDHVQAVRQRELLVVNFQRAAGGRSSVRRSRLRGGLVAAGEKESRNGNNDKRSR
jgi:hypothetical protein